MITLPNKFSKNGLTYQINERSETRYFAEIISELGSCIGYETGRIIRKSACDSKIGGVDIHFEEKEYITGNEQFGTDKFEEAFPLRMRSEAYRNFTEGIQHDENKSQMTSKFTFNKQENPKAIPDYHPEEKSIHQLEFEFL